MKDRKLVLKRIHAKVTQLRRALKLSQHNNIELRIAAKKKCESCKKV